MSTTDFNIFYYYCSIFFTFVEKNCKMVMYGVTWMGDVLGGGGGLKKFTLVKFLGRRAQQDPSSMI